MKRSRKRDGGNSGSEQYMYDFIINIPPLKESAIFFGPPWDMLLPPLVGSFLGVIGALLSNYALQSHFAHKDKIKYINMIRSELELCITTLKQEKVELLPTDRWTSAINSGALKLFDTETELQQLSAAYLRIRDYNHRAISEHFDVYDWKRLEREDGYRLPLMIVRLFQKSRQQLIDDLIKLRDAKFLNPAPGVSQLSPPPSKEEAKEKGWWPFWKRDDKA